MGSIRPSGTRRPRLVRRVLVTVAATLLMLATSLPTAGPAPTVASFPGDNGKIIFGRTYYYFGSHPDLYSVNADDTGLTRLTQTEAAGYPDISPDGRAIVDWATGPIEVRNLDGSNPRTVALGFNSSPTWSSDGSHIVYFVGDTNPDPWIVDAAGVGPPERYLEGCFVIGRIAFSADGKIAFHAFCDGDVGWALYTADANGTNLTPIVTNNDPLTTNIVGLTWSPDSQHLAFSASTDYLSCGTGANQVNLGKNDIYVIDRDGSDLTNLTNTRTCTSRQESNPAWSPDGTKIAFDAFKWDLLATGAYTPRRSAIWVMNANGSSPLQYTTPPDTYNDIAPAWAPAGVPPIGAALKTTASESADPITEQSTVTYTVTVHNEGSKSAANVALSATLPAASRDAVVTVSGSPCPIDGSWVATCQLGTVLAAGTKTVIVKIRSVRPGTISASFVASTTSPESDSSDNDAVVTTTVKQATAVVTYAPMFVFDPTETHFPIKVADFVAGSSLRFVHDEGCTHSVKGLGTIDPAKLGEIGGVTNYTHREMDGPCAPAYHTTLWRADQNTRPHGGDEYYEDRTIDTGEGFFLDLDDSLRTGTPSGSATSYTGSVPVYYQYRPPTATKDGYIRYYVLTGYTEQPRNAGGSYPAHEGGWSGVAIRLSRTDGHASAIAFFQPDGTSLYSWTSTNVKKTETTHPIVYLGDGSHGAYRSAGTWCLGTACSGTSGPYEKTGEGLRWRPWASSGGLQSAEQPWWGFGGAWGAARSTAAATGPAGPGLADPLGSPGVWSTVPR